MFDERVTARVRRTEDGLVHEYEVGGAVFNSLAALEAQRPRNVAYPFEDGGSR